MAIIMRISAGRDWSDAAMIVFLQVRPRSLMCRFGRSVLDVMKLSLSFAVSLLRWSVSKLARSRQSMKE